MPGNTAFPKYQARFFRSAAVGGGSEKSGGGWAVCVPGINAWATKKRTTTPYDEDPATRRKTGAFSSPVWPTRRTSDAAAISSNWRVAGGHDAARRRAGGGSRLLPRRKSRPGPGAGRGGAARTGGGHAGNGRRGNRRDRRDCRPRPALPPDRLVPCARRRHRRRRAIRRRRRPHLHSCVGNPPAGDGKEPGLGDPADDSDRGLRADAI